MSIFTEYEFRKCVKRYKGADRLYIVQLSKSTSVMSFAQFPNHSGLIHIEITHNDCLQDLDRARLRIMSKSTLAEANDRDYSLANCQPLRQHIATIVFTYRNLSGAPTIAKSPCKALHRVRFTSAQSNRTQQHATERPTAHFTAPVICKYNCQEHRPLPESLRKALHRARFTSAQSNRTHQHATERPVGNITVPVICK